MQKILISLWFFWLIIGCLILGQETWSAEDIADLHIEKTLVSSFSKEVVSGQEVDWKVSIRNRGPSTAINVVMEDPYSDSNLYSVSKKPDGCRDDGEKLQCAFPFLLIGDEIVFFYSTSLHLDAPLGPSISFAYAYSDQSDLDERDNQARVHFTILHSADDSSFADKQNDLENESVGELFSYPDSIRPVELEISDISLPSEYSLSAERSSQVVASTTKSGPRVWQGALLSIVLGILIRFFYRMRG